MMELPHVFDQGLTELSGNPSLPALTLISERQRARWSVESAQRSD